jgi:hypothetical protein
MIETFMKFFNNKKPEHGSETKECSCKQAVFIINKQQASRLGALMLVVAVFVFIGGYFWGQHTAVEHLLNSIERDSFADQIYSSMCSLYDQRDDESNEPDVVSGEEDIESPKEHVTSAIQTELGTTATYAPDIPSVHIKPHNSKKFYAQLIGFGQERSAQQLVARLEKKGISTKVHKRLSQTRRGKTIPWYQVVTLEYADKAVLQAVLDRIKNYEKLHDIKIVEAS